MRVYSSSTAASLARSSERATAWTAAATDDDDGMLCGFQYALLSLSLCPRMTEFQTHSFVGLLASQTFLCFSADFDIGTGLVPLDLTLTELCNNVLLSISKQLHRNCVS